MCSSDAVVKSLRMNVARAAPGYALHQPIPQRAPEGVPGAECTFLLVSYKIINVSGTIRNIELIAITCGRPVRHAAS